MAQYLGNTNPTPKEVHDTYNEKSNCQLGEIKAEHKVWFNTLSEAHAAGHDNCAWCIGGSTG